MNESHLDTMPMVVGNMSLRDYFAGQALAGLLSARDAAAQGKWFPNAAEATVRTAYTFADTMLAARAEYREDKT